MTPVVDPSSGGGTTFTFIEFIFTGPPYNYHRTATAEFAKHAKNVDQEPTWEEAQMEGRKRVQRGDILKKGVVVWQKCLKQ